MLREMDILEDWAAIRKVMILKCYLIFFDLGLEQGTNCDGEKFATRQITLIWVSLEDPFLLQNLCISDANFSQR